MRRSVFLRVPGDEGTIIVYEFADDERKVGDDGFGISVGGPIFDDAVSAFAD
jgi:hypothetical protein